MFREKEHACGISRISALNGVGGEEIFCHLTSVICNTVFLRNFSSMFLLYGFPVYGYTVILNKLERQKYLPYAARLIFLFKA